MPMHAEGQHGGMPGGAGGAVAASEEELYAIDERRKAKEGQDVARLDALGQSLARTRAEAIKARQSSGIEEIWYEDEEFFAGIDDANRGEVGVGMMWRQKPPGQAGRSSDAATTRSTVFPNITGPYCDAAAARIADMLLPTDDRSWALKPTPVPELVGIAKGKYPKPMLAGIAGAHPGDPAGARNELAIATRAALEVVSEAKEKAEKAQTRIE